MAELSQRLLEALRLALPEGTFNSWFVHCEVTGLAGECLTIRLPNSFTRHWIERNHLPLLEQQVKNILGEGVTISLVEANGIAAAPETTIPEAVETAPVAPPTRSDSALTRATFKNFLAGAHNRVALAACEQAVEAPGRYSPLVLIGGHGLGKSHLLRAIAGGTRKQGSEVRIEFVSAEGFLNAFTTAIGNKLVPRFRERFRSADLLLIDDLHIIAAGSKEATQGELVNTLDALQAAGKQVVLSSLAPLTELKGIAPALRDRIAAGLNLQLTQPDAHAREGLFAQKLRERGLNLEPDILTWLARHVNGTIREIEGAVMKLDAAAHLGRAEVTLESIPSLLGIAPTLPAPAFSLEGILQATAEEYGLTLADLRGKRRQRRVAAARSLAILLARRLTGASLQEIGTALGGRNHTTILSSLKNAPDLLDKEGRPGPIAENVLLRLGHAANTAQLLANQGKLFPA